MKKGQKETIDLTAEWRVHTPNLLNEMLDGLPGSWALVCPFRILGKLLYEVGERAAQINDPELNALMCRLTIYAIANPSDTEYDQERVNRIFEEAEQAKQKRKSDNLKV